MLFEGSIMHNYSYIAIASLIILNIIQLIATLSAIMNPYFASIYSYIAILHGC